MYRLYVEKADSDGVLWAIDEGDPSTARFFSVVIVESIGFSKHDPTQDNVSNPQIWIEFPEAKLRVVNRVAILRTKGLLR